MRQLAEAHALSPTTVEQIIEPYRAWITAANARDAAERLTERTDWQLLWSPWRTRSAHLLSRRVLLELHHPLPCKCSCTTRTRFSTTLEAKAGSGIKEPATPPVVFRELFKSAYFLYRHFGIRRLLADRLAERVELLLVTRLLLDGLVVFNNERLRPIFGERVTGTDRRNDWTPP